MERELWTIIKWGLRRLPRRWPRNAVYANTEILAVFLWAAMHNRPIDWACERSSWPIQAWRQRLPDQSTMSRRLKDQSVWDDLRLMLESVQSRFGNEHEDQSTYIVDGKPLPVSNISGDPDAARGWGAGIYARGYKLHAIIDAENRMIEFDVQPLNKAESVIAGELVKAVSVERPTNLLADAGYDSNPLHRACEANGIQLIAPRRRPGTGLGWVKGGHSAGRLRSIQITEGPGREWDRVHRFVRLGIERFFGTLATPATGLFALPPWVRRLHRVRAWVAAKLVINAARIVRRREIHA